MNRLLKNHLLLSIVTLLIASCTGAAGGVGSSYINNPSGASGGQESSDPSNNYSDPGDNGRSEGLDATRPTPGFDTISIDGFTDAKIKILCESSEGELIITESKEDGSFKIQVPAEAYYTVTFDKAPMVFDADPNGSTQTSIFYAGANTDNLDLGEVKINQDIAHPDSNPLTLLDTDRDGISDLQDPDVNPKQTETVALFTDEAMNSIVTSEDDLTDSQPGDDGSITEEPTPPIVVENEPTPTPEPTPPIVVENEPISTPLPQPVTEPNSLRPESDFDTEKERILGQIDELKALKENIANIKTNISDIWSQLRQYAPSLLGHKLTLQERAQKDLLKDQLTTLQDDLLVKKSDFYTLFTNTVEKVKQFRKKWKTIIRMDLKEDDMDD